MEKSLWFVQLIQHRFVMLRASFTQPSWCHKHNDFGHRRQCNEHFLHNNVNSTICFVGHESHFFFFLCLLQHWTCWLCHCFLTMDLSNDWHCNLVMLTSWWGQQPCCGYDWQSTSAWCVFSQRFAKCHMLLHHWSRKRWFVSNTSLTKSPMVKTNSIVLTFCLSIIIIPRAPTGRLVKGVMQKVLLDRSCVFGFNQATTAFIIELFIYLLC